MSERFLRRYQRESSHFLRRIIGTNETWFYNFDPKSKQQSCGWKTASSPPPREANVTKSAGKHMFIVFMDASGVLLTYAVLTGVTANADYYSKVLCFPL